MAAANTLELLNFDAAYLRALRKANAETERHFYSYFSPLIQRKLRKYLHAPDLIQEGAQETLFRVLTAVRSGAGIRQPERFGAFVHAVCKNVAMEIIRRERRFAPLEEADEYKPSRFDSPYSWAEAREARERVREVLASLSTFDRELLQALFLTEEDRPILCQRYGVSEGYLRVLLHRAKQKFIERISEERPKAYAAAAATRSTRAIPSTRGSLALKVVPIAHTL
jgi:RNA polymerase sigma factor (sigma-70 family)